MGNILVVYNILKLQACMIFRAKTYIFLILVSYFTLLIPSISALTSGDNHIDSLSVLSGHSITIVLTMHKNLDFLSQATVHPFKYVHTKFLFCFHLLRL